MYQKRLSSSVIISLQENALNAFLIYWPWWWLHGFAHFVTIYKDAYLALFYIFVIFQLKRYLKKNFFFHCKRLSMAFGPFQGKKWRSLTPSGPCAYLPVSHGSPDEQCSVSLLFPSGFLTVFMQIHAVHGPEAFPDSQESDLHWEPTGSSADRWFEPESVLLE